MRKISGIAPFVMKTEAAPTPWTAWNRGLLIGAAIFILWLASVLALQVAGPHAQAMLAGEGMLITPTQ
jgi:hypothetical protein